jgi:hypothetical protein
LETRLGGQATVVVWGQGLESADAAAARAAELLAAQAGVRRVAVLDPDESDWAVREFTAGRSWGADGVRLMSVSGAPNLMPSSSGLRKMLNTHGVAAVIDDHRGFGGSFETRALIAGGAGIAVGLLLCAGLFAVCFANGLDARGAEVARFDLMGRLGADPAYIGAIVGWRLGMVGLAGAIVGTVCADLVLLAATLGHGFWRSLGAMAFVQPQPRDGAWTLASPILVMAIAAIGGGLGARQRIAHRERRI